MPPSKAERERQKNIERNAEWLRQLDLKGAADALIPKVEPPKTKTKPVASARDKKRRATELAEAPRRKSARLTREVIDPNESPSKKKKREAELEKKRQQEEEERLEAERLAALAKLPRHDDLSLETLAERDEKPEDLSALRYTFKAMISKPYPRPPGKEDLVLLWQDDHKSDAAELEVEKAVRDLKVVSRAKVTGDRIYSAVYHGDKTKDLIFFGDKSGQVGIWDARAAKDEEYDDDGDIIVRDETEGGKIWRLQLHWPSTSRSSISSCKLDPLDSHSIYTTSYDGTVRKMSFESGISQEIFAFEDGALPSSADLTPSGNEMWISDSEGVVTHLDLREPASKTRRYGLTAGHKIGSVSINPIHTHSVLCASNDRSLRLWDARMLTDVAGKPKSSRGSPSKVGSALNPAIVTWDALTKSNTSKGSNGPFVAEFLHKKSVSSAYWNPHGNHILSTSYDDLLRVWNVDTEVLTSQESMKSFKPTLFLNHNCQTGRWLSIFKAQWSPNPNAFPHFTVGNMDHSLDIISAEGKSLAKLRDPTKITAVQAVTCSSPSVVARAASGNASGRCVLWAPEN
ncbi:WD40 repeat-like protein [Sistotremastrum niveocremeum HHB9708]|uniref:DNA damage-binding protein CMR1 n=1 Tax=Sistotremastrum niveocremeum HHB9708 TaxID=1314777 RepID=A0A165ALI5_9AGAM|nr:WD40 repeat-like protein [Sistotremastrum niveocremeum HHB9708]